MNSVTKILLSSFCSAMPKMRNIRENGGAKMSVCLIIASYDNYLLFDFSMYVIRMFLSASEKCERSDVSFNMTRTPLMKHCCNMC